VIVPVWNGDWRPGVRAHYRPTLEPQLVEHFAAVGDEESLLAFASRYGLLGYRQLHPARETGEEKHRGEPVAWSLAHARTVAGALGVLQLIDAVRKGQVRVDDNSRKAVAYAFANEFHRAGIEGPHNDPQPGSVSFSYLSPENAIFGVDDGDHVRRLVSRGLRAVRLGKRLLIPQVEIDRMNSWNGPKATICGMPSSRA
jgi:hypothetical protein